MLIEAMQVWGEGANDSVGSNHLSDSAVPAYHDDVVDELHLLHGPVLLFHPADRGRRLPRLDRKFAGPQQAGPESPEEAVRAAPDALLRLQSVSPPIPMPELIIACYSYARLWHGDEAPSTPSSPRRHRRVPGRVQQYVLVSPPQTSARAPPPPRQPMVNAASTATSTTRRRGRGRPRPRFARRDRSRRRGAPSMSWRMRRSSRRR